VVGRRAIGGLVYPRPHRRKPSAMRKAIRDIGGRLVFLPMSAAHNAFGRSAMKLRWMRSLAG
jgi:hypothetical protein